MKNKKIEDLEKGIERLKEAIRKEPIKESRATKQIVLGRLTRDLEKLKEEGL